MVPDTSSALLDDELGDPGSLGSGDDLAALDEFPTVDPSASADVPEDTDGFSLDSVAEEPPSLLDAETELSMQENTGEQTQVAVAPQNQKFDLDSIEADLPAVRNMTVQKSGSNTLITFDREASMPYKFFKMVNPSRIVVEFKDAKNQLKPEYPRFSGTKISRVETRQYANPSGTMIRVILYVDGAPNFTSSKKGNQLMVELQ